jgi:GAF domain-containing protein
MSPTDGPGWRRWGAGLQPLAETRDAIDELDPTGEANADLLDDLLDRGRRVRELVPDCVGLSLALAARGVTLTLVASDRDAAVLDAIQYLDAGPCVDAAAAGRAVTFDDDQPSGQTSRGPDEAASSHLGGGSGPDSEDRWHLFAQAAAAVGVRSSLTLPILTDGAVIGSVNLYAASPRAFEGQDRDIAAIFSAWAPGAVRNADLSFTTMETAYRAPQILRDAVKVEVAVGCLLAMFDIDDEREARRRLSDAALRAGVHEVQLAEALMSLLDQQRGPGR